MVELRRKARLNPYSVDYLTGQLHLLRGEPDAALGRFLKAEEASQRRPGLHLQVGRAYLAMKQWNEAQRSFLTALEIDPGNPHAQLGMAQCFLAQRRNRMAAEAALAALAKLHHFPMAHFVLARALVRLRRPKEAVLAARQALAINPHFPEAHDLLARIYRRRLRDPVQAEAHRNLAAEIRSGRPGAPIDLPGDERKTGAGTGPVRPEVLPTGALAFPPEATRGQPVIVVTGLPRSGTSLVMQMLVAGGVPAHTDGRREADTDNPRGYLEFEPVKRLPHDAGWLEEARGRAVKVVVPLLPFLPDTVPYRVIHIDRQPDEIMASQRTMLGRVGFEKDRTGLEPEKWRDELRKQTHRARVWLSRRPHVPVLELVHGQVLADAPATAAALNHFFGGAMDEAAMAAVVDAGLHRQRAGGKPG